MPESLTLESKLRALVAHWRGATKAFSADGASRPLEWEGKDILRVCADELEALLAERQPAVTVTSGAVPSCTADAIRESGKWKTFEYPALAERQEPLMDYLPDGSPSHGPYPSEIADREQRLRESVELLGQGQMDLAHELCEAQAKLARVIRLTKEWYKPKHQPREGRTVCECHFCFQQRSDADELKEVLDGKLLAAAEPSSGTGERK